MVFFKNNIQLKEYNSFAVAANAAFFAEFAAADELKLIVEECKAQNLEWYILGGGCNILFTGDFRGVIIHPTGKNVEQQGNLVIAEAGLDWDTFVEWCTERGLSGLENLSYIPGTVGASPVQNIGAYGAQVADCVEWVEYFDTVDMECKTIKATECQFGYRESIFKGELKGQAIITRVAYLLNPDFKPENAKLDYGDLRSTLETSGKEITIKAIREAVTAIRRSKLPEPSEVGNGGSFFKNPVIGHAEFEKLKEQYPTIPSYEAKGGIKVPAGWLIDQAGYKGFRRGAVGVHPKQALVLVNYGGGTASEVLDLAQEITEKVNAKFGITISKEINVL